MQEDDPTTDATARKNGFDRPIAFGRKCAGIVLIAFFFRICAFESVGDMQRPRFLGATACAEQVILLLTASISKLFQITPNNADIRIAIFRTRKYSACEVVHNKGALDGVA